MHGLVRPFVLLRLLLLLSAMVTANGGHRHHELPWANWKSFLVRQVDRHRHEDDVAQLDRLRRLHPSDDHPLESSMSLTETALIFPARRTARAITIPVGYSVCSCAPDLAAGTTCSLATLSKSAAGTLTTCTYYATVTAGAPAKTSSDYSSCETVVSAVSSLGTVATCTYSTVASSYTYCSSVKAANKVSTTALSAKDSGSTCSGLGTSTTTKTSTTTETMTVTFAVISTSPTTVYETATFIQTVPGAGLAGFAAAAAACGVALGVAVPLTATAGANAQARSLANLLPAAPNVLTPVNGLAIPVPDVQRRADVVPSKREQCGDTCTRFSKSLACWPVLKRGPCTSPLYWITVDPETLQAACSPRLCRSNRRVFVGGDGLCHSVDDESLNQRGGRRLYYTAYGDPINDCPIGQYPFPYPEDDCVSLFTQGPCLPGQVVSFTTSGQLGCRPQPCRIGSSKLQWVPDAGGRCYPLGTRGPCRGPTELYAYDVFQRRPACHDIRSPLSPYFQSGHEKTAFRTSRFDGLVPEVGHNLLARKNRTAGATAPVTFVEPLLNPCRPGARVDNNFKCTNPLIPRVGKQRRSSRPKTSLWNCDEDGGVLQANGQCDESILTASCGPSYEFHSSDTRCRKTDLLVPN